MSEPFLAEIKVMSFNYAPRGWAFCNGQMLPINQNQALFALLGTTYGGNGQTTFALPDLRGRVPIHMGNNMGDIYTLGQKGGEQSHTLTGAETPTHTHVLNATNNNGATANPSGAVLGAFSNGYIAPQQLTTLHPASMSTVGGSQPHANMQPYLSLSFCIALQGIFPSRN